MCGAPRPTAMELLRENARGCRWRAVGSSTCNAKTPEHSRPRISGCRANWRKRGFAGTSHSHPHLNPQLTPSFLAGRKQFTADEVSLDLTTCRLRYNACEVAFARVTHEALLKDTVPYENMKFMDATDHWGHAMINLMGPFRRGGVQSPSQLPCLARRWL